VSAATLPTEGFVSFRTRATRVERAALVLLLALAAFLRLYKLDQVPPGIHDDEIINAQIVDDIRAGAPPAVFYQAGEGREGLYHLLLLASRTLVDRVPYWYRLPSVACSLATILLVYVLSRRLFGPWTALVAAGGLAVAFWPVLLGREALRVVLMPPVAAGLALALWSGLEQPRWDRRAAGWFALAGLLMGLAQYTYLAARALPLLVLLYTLYVGLFHRATLRLHWRGMLLLLAVAALIAAPLLLYLGAHWEEQERIGRLSEPLQALVAGDPRPVLSSAAATVGVFVWEGDPQAHYNLPNRPVFEPVGAVLFIAGVALAAARMRRPNTAFCVLWTLAALVPGMLTEPAPHAVRTAGALVSAFVFPGLAVGWVADRLDRRGRLALAIALVLLLAANVGLTTRDYLYRWAERADVRSFRHAELAEAARYLDGLEDTVPVAVCTPFLNEEHFFWRTDRQAMPYLLNRDDLTIGWYDCQQAQLFPQEGERALYLAGADQALAPFMPGHWARAGEEMAVFGGSHLLSLDLEQELRVWLGGLQAADAEPSAFGGVMTLLGYQMDSPSAAPGDVLEVLTAWWVMETPPGDLAIFLHLLDGDGMLVGQGDALAALSDTLQPHDVLVQRHVVALEEGLKPGEYLMTAGLYVRGGERLRLDNGEGDFVAVETVELVDAGH
jgi:4-amino-4-deoxy-L-arabinose transferase-like glycosyltransferase